MLLLVLAIGIDDVNCGRSALVATAAAQRFRSLVEENELLDRRKRIVNGVLGSLIYFPWQVSRYIWCRPTPILIDFTNANFIGLLEISKRIFSAFTAQGSVGPCLG